MTSKIKTKNSIYVKIIGFFLVLTIGAIFLILHFALSKVTIKIFSRSENKNTQIIVPLIAENTPEAPSDALIGTLVNVELELEGTADSSSGNVLAEKAGAEVIIYNKYSKDQTLVKTTRLQAPDGKIYRITDRVLVPQGGEIKVWAEADQVGSDYASEAIEKLTIPGLWAGLQDKIYASAPNGFKMESRPGYQVTKENIDQAQNNLLAEAKKQGLEKINALLADNLKIDEKRLYVQQEILSSSALGDSTPQTKIKEKVTIYGLVFAEDDLYRLAEKKFSAQLSSEQKVEKFFPEQYSYKISELDLEKKEAIIEVNLNAQVEATSRPWQIDKSKLTGLNKKQIAEYLESEFSISDADIKFFPFWVHTAPKLKDHIIIE